MILNQEKNMKLKKIIGPIIVLLCIGVIAFVFFYVKPFSKDKGGMGGFGGGMGGFAGGFGGGDAVGMFAAYRVSSYDEEISVLKKFFADRIAFLDSNWK